MSPGGARAPFALSLGRLGLRMADAYLACACGLVVELLGVAFAQRRELVGAWEVGIALRVLPLAWILLAPFAMVAGTVVEGLAGGVTRLAPGAFRAREHRRRRMLAVVGAALLVAMLAEVAAATSLQQGSKATGVVLAGGAMLACAAVSLAREQNRRGRVVPIAAVVFFALSAVVAPRTLSRLAPADNVRRVVAGGAPLLGNVVRLAELLSPQETVRPVETAGDATIDFRGSDVILITIDGLRADHVGAYGYDRSSTPNIDRLAASGVVFEAAYTPTPDTPYAVASIMTGKHMRSLALEGVGADSETIADVLGRYGLSTGCVVPDDLRVPPELAKIAGNHFGFHDHQEVADPADFASRISSYVVGLGPAPAFVWVHLDASSTSAQRDTRTSGLDSYDQRVRALDALVGQLTALVARLHAVTIIAGTRGEAFDEHGVRDHEAGVYEEDVRVPLVVVGSGVVPGHVRSPISLVDLMPTLLRAEDIPRPSRVHGEDRTASLRGGVEAGFAFAETRGMTMVAEDAFRFVCVRQSGLCALFNVDRDRGEARDITSNHPDVVARLRTSLERAQSSRDRFEVRDAEGAASLWPEPLRRGISGDGSAAIDVAKLLDDPDVAVRRKSAEVLVELRRAETSPNLKRALASDRDETVRDFSAIALTRLGDASPRTVELLMNKDTGLRRLAALVLAEQGDDRSTVELVAWWREAFPHDPGEPATPIEPERAKEILAAFSKTKPRPAILPLIDSLRSPRLRPYIAATLADIGDDAARVPLSDLLLVEHSAMTRRALLDALMRLKTGAEIVKALIAQLGAPEPIARGLEAALHTKMLQHVGGPAETSENERMKRFASTGVSVDFFVPDVDGAAGVRAICLANSTGEGEIRIGRRLGFPSSVEKKSPIPTEAPGLDPARSMTLKVGASQEPFEVFATIPAALDVRPGKPASLVVFATENVSLEACALVPLASGEHSH